MKNLKWTLELSVDPKWIADGFDVTPEKMDEVLGLLLPHATEGEMSLRVVKCPTKEQYEKAEKV